MGAETYDPRTRVFWMCIQDQAARGIEDLGNDDINQFVGSWIATIVFSHTNFAAGQWAWRKMSAQNRGTDDYWVVLKSGKSAA